jgi:hypothetical protein
MKRASASAVLVIALALCAGCASSSSGRNLDYGSSGTDVSANASSLLYDVLSDERHVGKLLLIKRERPEVNRLIKKIAETARVAAGQIERFAEQDGNVRSAAAALKSAGLPPGELATREAVADTKRRQLLQSSGEEFERLLLLTQLEALSYTSHLASVLARNNPNPGQAAYYRVLSGELKSLHSQVFQLLFPGSAGVRHENPGPGDLPKKRGTRDASLP